jgi:hypothetical protein
MSRSYPHGTSSANPDKRSQKAEFSLAADVHGPQPTVEMIGRSNLARLLRVTCPVSYFAQSWLDDPEGLHLQVALPREQAIKQGKTWEEYEGLTKPSHIKADPPQSERGFGT